MARAIGVRTTGQPDEFPVIRDLFEYEFDVAPFHGFDGFNDGEEEEKECGNNKSYTAHQLGGERPGKPLNTICAMPQAGIELQHAQKDYEQAAAAVIAEAEEGERTYDDIIESEESWLAARA
jgi:hypothetical protein